MDIAHAHLDLVELDAGCPLARREAGLIGFVGFDGIFHPEDCTLAQHFCFAQCIADGVNAADPGMTLAFVVCSHWRRHESLSSLRHRLPRVLGQRLIGVTPDLDAHGGTRGDEVRLWLQRHAPQARWIAVDEHPHWYGHDRHRVFTPAHSVASPAHGIDPAERPVFELWLRAHLNPFHFPCQAA